MIRRDIGSRHRPARTLRRRAVVLWSLCIALLFAVPSVSRSQSARGGDAASPDSLAERIWWNQDEMIAGLDLTTSQRQRADALLSAFLEDFSETRERLATAQEKLLGHLEAGRLDDASAVLDEIEELTGKRAVSQAQMKVDILRLLDEEQATRLREEHSHLLKQAWVRRQRFGGGERKFSGAPLREVARPQGDSGSR